MRKFIFISTILLMSCLTGMAISPFAQNRGPASGFKFKSKQAESVYDQSDLYSFRDITTQEGKDSRSLSPSSPMRADEEMYTLTVNLIYDKEEIEECIYPSVAFPNYENGVYTSEWSWENTPESLEFMVPKGKYDIEVRLITINDDFILLTATDVDVIGDMEISLDAKDATVEIEWNAWLPDGSVPTTGIPVLDPITEDILEYLPGNVFEYTNTLNIFNKKHNLGSNISFQTSYWIIDNEQFGNGLGKVKSIPNTDYALYLQKKLVGTEGGYVISLKASTSESMEVTNNIKNYVTIKPEYAYTPYQPDLQIQDEEFDKDNECSLGYLIIQNGKMTGISSLGIMGGYKVQKWLHICQNPETIDEYQIMPIPILREDPDSRNCMQGLPINTVSNPPMAFAINNTSLLKFSSYLNLPEEKGRVIEDVSNPWLSFDITKPHVWNYGCPALVFSTKDSEGTLLYDLAYIGRLGEFRGTDLLSTEARVLINDELPSDEVLESIQWGELPNEGKIDFEFVDTNVVIDEYTGKNIARIGFDMSRSDWQPPTLQLVRFVDIDNNFTDRYASGEEGVIEFYGGDFKYNLSLETYIDWYTEEPAAEVKVEYAPYGSDNFSPLEVENIPERNFMPGFGTYYTGSLAGVDCKSETGWFDVRITLTDAAGNYQEQTLSPAFKIESLTGIDSISDIASSVRVDGRDIIAPDNARIFSINGAPVNGYNLQPGIYFVTLSGNTTKVLVK